MVGVCACATPDHNPPWNCSAAWSRRVLQSIYLFINLLINKKMLTATQTTAKVLQILAPSNELIEGSHKAKIVSDVVTYSNEFKVGDKEKMVIAQILVAIEGQKPFNCAIFSDDVATFCNKYSKGDGLDIYIQKNAKNPNYKNASC